MLCSTIMHKGTVLRRCGKLDESSVATRAALDVVSTERDPYLSLNAQANLALTEGLAGDERIDDLARIQLDAASAQLAFVRLKAQMFAAILAYSKGDMDLAIKGLESCLPEQLQLGHINLIAQELAPRPELVGCVLRRHSQNGIGPSVAEALSRYWDFDRISPVLETIGAPHASAWLSHGSSRPQKPPSKAQDSGIKLSSCRCAGLTAREAEVLELMARNRSNEEIAAELYIALSTVKTHVNHILRKLNQKTRVGAILEYQRLVAQSPPSPDSRIHPGYDSNRTPQN